MKKSRVAYCLYGLSGGAKGKDGRGADPEIFRLGFKHANKYLLLHNNMDVFIHTWSVESEEELKKLYKPVKSIFEPQRYFDVPEWIGGGRSSSDCRSDSLNAHYSRWYSTQKVLELKKQYEKENGFTYDFVMTTRFDLAWQRQIKFENLNPDKFYSCRCCVPVVNGQKMSNVKYWHQREGFTAKTRLKRRYKGYPCAGGKSWGFWDVWFISSSNTMDSFATIYDNLAKYCKNKRMIKRRMKKIVMSNHLIPFLWLEGNGWLKKSETFMNSIDDCAPVRMWYKRFHEGKHYK